MAFTTYEFPFTRAYDGDLGFLIKNIQNCKPLMTAWCLILHM